jgi:acetate kinase
MLTRSSERLTPVAVSARHVHLSQATIDRLFGPGYVLRARGPVSQPGQFAALESVALTGPRGRLEHVRVVGPPRLADQVEISFTDERHLGIDAPLRLSGDLCGTPGVTVEGPEGRGIHASSAPSNARSSSGASSNAASRLVAFPNSRLPVKA